MDTQTNMDNNTCISTLFDISVRVDAVYLIGLCPQAYQTPLYLAIAKKGLMHSLAECHMQSLMQSFHFIFILEVSYYSIMYHFGWASVYTTFFFMEGGSKCEGVKWKIMSIWGGEPFWCFPGVDLASLVIWGIEPPNPCIDHTGVGTRFRKMSNFQS